MPTLVLLNGPPASGKSTIAARLVAERPLALNLDIDVVRSLLGDWKARPPEAGIAVRRLALVMAREHLGSGHDVIVPQFLAKAEFIDQLADSAGSIGAEFVEIALMIIVRMPSPRSNAGVLSPSQRRIAMRSRLSRKPVVSAR